MDQQPQRVALVTGGAVGLGRAIALRLVADGVAPRNEGPTMEYIEQDLHERGVKDGEYDGVVVTGIGLQGNALTLKLQLTAFDDKGPQIPSCAAVALMAKVVNGECPEPGARTCVGFIGSDEYLDAIGEQDKLRLDVHFSDPQD